MVVCVHNNFLRWHRSIFSILAVCAIMPRFHASCLWFNPYQNFCREVLRIMSSIGSSDVTGVATSLVSIRSIKNIS
ncbi:hypothetical protein BDR07DRAFT_1421438 [Suillus spraguei]|nr:hypothetical protein BDR07DRAFT_1421438 [Suillus spraguei]